VTGTSASSCKVRVEPRRGDQKRRPRRIRLADFFILDRRVIRRVLRSNGKSSRKAFSTPTSTAGHCSGRFFMAAPPMRTQVSCASRSASTCAHTRVPERNVQPRHVDHRLRSETRRASRRARSVQRSLAGEFWRLCRLHCLQVPTGIDIRQGSGIEMPHRLRCVSVSCL
jgi:hypothetical protein